MIIGILDLLTQRAYFEKEIVEYLVISRGVSKNDIKDILAEMEENNLIMKMYMPVDDQDDSILNSDSEMSDWAITGKGKEYLYEEKHTF